MPSFERHAAFRISQQCISTKLLELRNVMERSWIETRTATNRVLPRIQINKADMIMMSGLWACDVAHAPTQPINHARLEKKIRMFWKSCIEIPVCCQLFQLNPENVILHEKYLSVRADLSWNETNVGQHVILHIRVEHVQGNAYGTPVRDLQCPRQS